MRMADRPTNDDDAFDEFLNDATLAVRDMWESKMRTRLSEHETYALNDALTAFFSDKMPPE